MLPTVHAQKAALRIDIAAQHVAGWTELLVTPPPAPPAVAAAGDGSAPHVLGLHVHGAGLRVLDVTVGGQPAAFQVLPPQHEELPSSVSYASAEALVASVGGAAAALYERALEAEAAPRLVIALPPPGALAAGTGGAADAGAGADAAGRVAVQVRYEVAAPRGGLRFWGAYCCTDNAVRRTGAWLPCADVPQAAVDFQLQLTVRAGEVAVGPGRLAEQAWADAARSWRTFHYVLPAACAPCELAFAAGALEAVPGPAAAPQAARVTHFAPPPPGPEALGGAADAARRAASLAHTAEFFALALSFLEGNQALGAPLPWADMQQVFMPPEVLGAEVQTAPGLQILSTRLLLDPRAVEAGLEARCAAVRALARQWAGHLLRPAAPGDAWLLEGVVGWLEGRFVRRFMGRNELKYRRWRERAAVAAADNGDAPPLAPRAPAAAAAAAAPWGALHGTEALDPSPLRSLKATLVVCMLEQRVGEELFRRHVEAAAAGAAKPGAPPGARALAADAFLGDLARAGGFRKELEAFLERWVWGRGAPRLTAGYFYHRRGSTLELAVRQGGPACARAAAARAEAVGARAGVGDPLGVVKVVVREAEAPAEHPVHLGAQAAALALLEVNPDLPKRAPGRRGGRRKRDEDELAREEREAREAARRAEDDAQLPVQWVRLDPGAEWLADVRMLQPERMWANQLAHSRDAVAQAEAVRGLAELRVGPRSDGGTAALARALDNAGLFHRVRAEAAAGLGRLRDADGRAVGAPALAAFYRERYCEAGGVPRAVAFPDLAEYHVARAVLAALAACREPGSGTASDALHVLVVALDQYRPRWEGWDDSGVLAALCDAVGGLVVPALPDLAANAVKMLARLLARDVVVGSPGAVVGRACVGALARLAAASRMPGLAAAAHEHLERCNSPGVPLPLRAAAHAAEFRLLAGTRGAAAALGFAVAVARGAATEPAVAQAVWEEAALAAEAIEPAELSLDVLLEVGSLLHAADDPRLRHLAFVVLQRLRRRPPTLFKPSAADAALDEEASAGAGLPPPGLASPGAEGGAAVRVKLKLPAAAPGVSTHSGPAATAVSDGRAASLEEGVEQKPPPLEGGAEGAAPWAAAAPEPSATAGAVPPGDAAPAPAPAPAPAKFKLRLVPKAE